MLHEEVLAVTRTPECDLVAVLLDEHRALHRTTDALTGGSGCARSVMALLTEVCRYGRTLEGHLDPLIRRYLPDGQARADRRLGEYVQVERLVAELRRNRPGDLRCTELLGALVSRLRGYLADQERELLPRVHRHVPADVLRQRGVLAIRGGRAPDPAQG
jgi:murein tripeptide amidase MpaA